MTPALLIESTLNHDGDGVVRLYLTVHSEHFAGAAGAWCGDEAHLHLASALAGFPASSDSRAEHKIGSAKLELFCTDRLGHVGIWVRIEAEHDVVPSMGKESSRVLLKVEPSAIDDFVHQLRGFVPGRKNKASLARAGA